MPSSLPATTIRLTEEDRTILAKLTKMTGLESHSALIRMAIRESLAAREAARGKRK